HVGVERVHLGGAVDPHEQQGAALLGRDLRLVVHKTLYNAAVDACHRLRHRLSDANGRVCSYCGRGSNENAIFYYYWNDGCSVCGASIRTSGKSQRQVSVHTSVLGRFYRQIWLRDAERRDSECLEPDWCLIACLDQLVFATSHMARKLE